jgi:hypothetical protein
MDEFLDRVSELFEVVVFTASQVCTFSKDIILLITVIACVCRKTLRLLRSTSTFDSVRCLNEEYCLTLVHRHRLYREHCLPIEDNYLKDLNVLGRNLAHVYNRSLFRGLELLSLVGPPSG